MPALFYDGQLLRPMDNITVLVLADPAQPQLEMLKSMSQPHTLVAGNHLETFEQSAAEADVIFSFSGKRDLLEQVWRRAPRVRWVHSLAAGLDKVLFPALAESPVPLTNSRGVFSQSLSEFVIGAILFFAKDFRRMLRNQAAGIWQEFVVDEVRHQTLGIFGYGDIGRAVAQRAKGLGMKVLALRRRPELSREDRYVDELFTTERKLDLIERSDYVVVAVPLTRDTRALVGEAEIGVMKSTAVLINVGRGAVIDEAALIRALGDKRIRGAALDVFEREPLPKGHPLFGLDNVLISPHCADNTSDWLEQATQFFIENFERFRRGEPLRNVVDKRLGY
jgi:phosphoglycerate dehydrogenase-like enzyme